MNGVPLRNLQQVFQKTFIENKKKYEEERNKLAKSMATSKSKKLSSLAISARQRLESEM